MLRHRPPAEITERARAHAEALGLERAAQRLGVSVPTAARLAAGLPVRRGTIRIVSAALAALDRRAEIERIAREGEQP